ncbi:E3 ubiquitin-protein ligase UHRF1-like [Periplaneta americana]|uniref:E3 ubiquitin-protein ligase UHRF1-like n=1 Tax=Periplaneta americana TaxID=6978 RepID=UPI0037E90720
MYVRVRTVDGKETAVITISKLTSVEEFRGLVERKLGIKIEKQRLFYRGKQLEDGYRIFDYEVRLNDVIQLMIKPDIECFTSSKSCHVPVTIESLPNKSDVNLQKCGVKCFQVGDLVDVKLLSYGAWFEGTVIDVVKRDEINHTDLKDTVHENKIECSKEYLNFGILQDDNVAYRVALEQYEEDEPLEVSLKNLRPRARHTCDFDSLKVNDVVMINYNIEKPESLGYWYDVVVTGIKKTKTSKELTGTIHITDDTFLSNCKIRSCDIMFKVEPSPVENNANDIEESNFCDREETDENQSDTKCSVCNDNINVKCRLCNCHVCGRKDSPETQVLCDDCNMAYHIGCLNPPLTTVPETDEWYCPDCKTDENEIVKAGEKLKDSKKKAKLPSQNSRSSRDWGKGMACVGRTKECTLVPSNHYGSIPGVEVGTCWLYRVQVSESGVHRPPVGGIHGRECDGAYSLVLSGGYEDDVDDGDEFLYTGSGGRDLSGNKRTADQSCDQTLTRLNKALALNCNVSFSLEGAEAADWKNGKPVRVVRSSKLRKHSKYAPEVGNRYDGLYKVVKYYPEKGKSGFVVWRYLLRRDDESPAPWTPEGKKLIELHGLDKPLVPDGYIEASKDENTGSRKRKSRDVLKCSSEKKLKGIEYKLEKSVKDLIDKDVNVKLWKLCSDYLKKGKQIYLAEVAQTFTCICCQELVHNPITTPCKHNICKNCLQRSFAAEVFTCPCCRYELGENDHMVVNENLAAILNKLFPGYENGR